MIKINNMTVFYLCILVMFSVLLVGCTTNNGTSTTTPGTTDNTNMPKEEPTTIQSVIKDALSPYSGKILAGNKTPYIEFNTDDYKEATADGKVILLYFYSEKSEVCRSDEIKVLKAFNDMASNQMIGFKVHYDDASTTIVESQLADTLEVKEAHTKVILKNGKVLQTNINTWDINDYARQMAQYLE